MASINKLVSAEVIPTDVEGLYLADAPLAELEAFDAKVKEDFASGVIYAFARLLVDEDGKPFDDRPKTAKQVKAMRRRVLTMSILQISKYGDSAGKP